MFDTIVRVQHEHGDRHDREHARLKYLIHEWGIKRFGAEVAQRLGRPLRVPEPVVFDAADDHLGCHPQGEGRWFLGVKVENGRIARPGRRSGAVRAASGRGALLAWGAPQAPRGRPAHRPGRTVAGRPWRRCCATTACWRPSSGSPLSATPSPARRAHLRPGAHRVRAGPARRARRAGSRARRAGARRARRPRPDDGLPQRLLPPVHRRDRLRGRPARPRALRHRIPA